MKKIIKTDLLITKYIIRTAISSILAVLSLSYLTGKIIIAADLSGNAIPILSVIIFCISVAIIQFVSVIGFKNNIFLLSILSSTPIMLLSLINTVVNGNSIMFLIIKYISVVIIALILTYVRVNKDSGFKVK